MIVVSPNESIPFNYTGVKSYDITLSFDRKTITINTTGVYQISYHIFAKITSPFTPYAIAGVSVFINGADSQLTNSGIQISLTNTDGYFCFPIDYSFQTSITSGSTIKFKNKFSANLETCNIIEGTISQLIH